MPAVIASDLVKTFPGNRNTEPVRVLRGISMHVDEGEMVAIVGPSGSGKSTLLYCLAGIETVDSGSVNILGTEIVGLKRSALARLRRDRLGFVFQSYNLIPSLNARENVALPARLARRPLSKQQVRAALTTVGVAEREGSFPSELSGGQQQRVAIARVLAATPDLVFADEPTGALDSQTGDAVLRLLRESTEDNRSAVLVTHDLAAASRADRVIVMRDGAIEHALVSPTIQDLFDATLSDSRASTSDR